MPSLAPFKLERYFALYEFNVKYLLCSSDCESLTIADLLALEPEATARFGQQWLGYTESEGSPTLRQAICSLYTTIRPEHVLVFAGAEEAIFLFMHATLTAADHLIVHWPCYQSLAEVAHSLGCQVSHWQAQEERGWALDLAELERLIQPNTKAIILNTPHNPTGYHLSPAQFQAVHDFARAHNLILFCDEVYREAEYRPEDKLPAGCDLGEHAVSLGVMSKAYGLAGLRIGWIATRHPTLRAKLAALKDYTTICNSAPSEFLAELALRHRATLTQRNVARLNHHLTLLDAFFARNAQHLTWQRPLAGPIAFPRLLQQPIEPFCEKLVQTTGVLLLPGSLYDHPGQHFRLGFGRHNLPTALARLEEFLQHSPH